MHAVVTAVFDVSRLLQSWKQSVEAYTAPRSDYSVVMVSVLQEPAATFLSCHFLLYILLKLQSYHSLISPSWITQHLQSFRDALPNNYSEFELERISSPTKSNAMARIPGYTDLS